MPERNESDPLNDELVSVSCKGAFSFSGEIGDKLLELIPYKSRVLLKTVGDDRDQIVGGEIHVFLEANGYDVIRLMARTAPEARSRLRLRIDAYGVQLTVAPSFRCPSS